jgi:hypothetical protein
VDNLIQHVGYLEAIVDACSCYCLLSKMVGTCFMLKFRWWSPHAKEGVHQTRLADSPDRSLRFSHPECTRARPFLLSLVAGRHSANLLSPIWNAFIRLRRNIPSVLDTSSHFLTVFTNHKRPYNLCSSQHPLYLPPRFMMGIPQDSHRKSKNKDKTKTKTKNASRKTKPSSTMPASTSSSMDPHNGSAIE